MKPTVVVCWPKDIFYPWFVWKINRCRDLFDKVIVVMTEGNLEFDFTKDIKAVMDKVMILQPDILNLTAGGLDWRNAAISASLSKAVSPYILFLEQDFLFNDSFIEDLLDKGRDYDAVGFIDGERFHPACLLVKKEILEQTSKDFSAYPPEGDHFIKLSQELKKLGKWTTLQDLGLTGWEHISGLSYNYRIKDPHHKKNEFYTYNHACWNLKMPDRWRNFVYDNMVVSAFADVEKITEFF